MFEPGPSQGRPTRQVGVVVRHPDAASECVCGRRSVGQTTTAARTRGQADGLRGKSQSTTWSAAIPALFPRQTGAVRARPHLSRSRSLSLAPAHRGKHP